MYTKEKAWDIIRDLNEEAHSDAWDLWNEADELEDAEPDEAEDMRVQASQQQCHYFRGYLEEHDGLKEACLQFAKEDEDFNMDWEAWYQPHLDQWLED